MIAAWMTWAILVASCVGAGAALVEWLLLAYRRPARWIWIGAIAGIALLTIVVPLATRVQPPTTSASPTASVRTGGSDARHPLARARAALAEPGRRLSAASARLALLDAPLLAFWIASSALLGALLLLVQRRLARERAGWPLQPVAGASVRVSPELGPAVVGWVRPEIVVPRWALAMSDDEQRLIVLHEQQHLEARDQQMLAIAILTLVAAPWNPALWWIVRRLRLAIEIDCDQRALRAGAGLRPYGELLLRIGARARNSLVPIAALAEGGATLVRRVRAFAAPPPRARRVRAGAALTAALLLFGIAGAWRIPEAIASGQPEQAPGDSLVLREVPGPIGAVPRGSVAFTDPAPTATRTKPRDTMVIMARGGDARPGGRRAGTVTPLGAGGRHAAFDTVSVRAIAVDSARASYRFDALRAGRGGGRGGRMIARPDTASVTSAAPDSVVRARPAAASATLTRRPPF